MQGLEMERVNGVLYASKRVKQKDKKRRSIVNVGIVDR